jgi:hypothetical protein
VLCGAIVLIERPVKAFDKTFDFVTGNAVAGKEDCSS